MDLLRYPLSVLGYALVLISLIPLLRSTWWLVRVFDYPRAQKFWINAFIILFYVSLVGWECRSDVIFLVSMFLNQIYLFRQIWDYTRFAPVQMKGAETKGDAISLLVANVCQGNRDAEPLLKLIAACDPVVVLLVETDGWWIEKIRVLGNLYPYRIEVPQENTYGMVLMSKLKIVHHAIRHLVEKEVPSIRADFLAPNGKRVRLYGLHPKPPVPHESDDSSERDAEILIIGKESKQCRLPVIVAGDLNDVAWSYTTHLFLKVSGLLDPRIGRGFYNTFHAKYPLMRWPLDHIFCSSHFYLHQLKIPGPIGSDHFPVFIEVGLMAQAVKENTATEKQADAGEIETAEEKISHFQFRISTTRQQNS